MMLKRTSEYKELDKQPRFPAQVIGERVRNRRIESGLSLEAVARVLGCQVAYLEAAESGVARFTPAQIVDLCPILRVMPSWFFEDIGEAG